MTKIGIIGSGDLGQLIAYHAVHSCSMQVAGFFDDYKESGQIVNGIPVIGKLADVRRAHEKGIFDVCMLGVGYKHMDERERIFEELHAFLPFGKVIHPSCIIDNSVLIGEGAFLLPGCVLDKGVKLGKNVLLNTACVIAHDTEVADHSFLSPAVKIAGFTKVGRKCVIGISTTIIDNIRVADEVRTGGGTVVIKNIEQAGLYVGNPARFVK